MSTSTKYVGSTTPEQKAELLEFLKSHPGLTSGKFTNDFTFKKARGLWESLANTLNAMPGARKDWKKWRKTWHDMKTRTKSKSSQVKQNRVRTGGGPPINIEITKDDEKILDIMGSVAVEGHPKVFESHVLFEEDAVSIPTTDIPVNSAEHSYASVDLEMTPDTLNLRDITNLDNVTKPSSSNISEQKHDMGKNEKKRIYRPKRLQRLDNTISATRTLAEQTERDITMRDKYHTQKLELYKEDIAVKARIASALESMAEAMREIV